MEFPMRANLEQVPVVVRNTPKGTVRVASPEATAFDLVGYPRHAGGLGNATAVVAELAEELDPEALVQVARLSPVPWAQRLGFLLDRVGASDRAEKLAAWVAERAPPATALDVASDTREASREHRWRVAVNAAIEVEP